MVSEGDRHSIRLAGDVEHDLADPVAALHRDVEALQGTLLGNRVLAGELERVLAFERQRWQRRLHDALLQAAAECEAQGRLAHALGLGARLLQVDPLDERAARLMMRLLERRGEPNAALRAFDELKDRLHRELGEPPSAETLELSLAIASRRTNTRATFGVPRNLRHPPRTIGREPQLAACRDRLDEGSHVLLVGAAGIGKSRLFDDLVVGMPIQLWLRLREGDQAAPLGLWRALSIQLLPWLQGTKHVPRDLLALLQLLGKGKADRAREPMMLGPQRLRLLLQQVLQHVCDNGLTYIGIDNLGFADAESLELMAGVLCADKAAAPQPTWLLTSRDPMPALVERWWQATDPSSHLLLPVSTLDEARVAELLESLALPRLNVQAWTAALHRHCEGHPLSLLQVLASLSEAGLVSAAPPPHLPVPREATSRLIRALDQSQPRAQKLAYVAALAGADFSPALAERLMRLKASDLLVPWRQLRSLGVFSDRGFSHEMMRQAVLEAVPLDLAPAVHGEIAQAMAEQGLSPERRSIHWEAAGQWSRAAEDAELAAEVPLAAGLVASARSLLLRAAGLYERAGDEAASFRCRWRAAAQARGSVANSQRLAEARQLQKQARTVEQQLLALCELADVLLEEQDETVLEMVREAAALAARSALPQLQLALSRRQAEALRQVGRSGEALALLESSCRDPNLGALSTKERMDFERLHAHLLGVLGRRREALNRFDQLLISTIECNDPYLASDMANQAGVHASYLCRLDDAATYARRSIELTLLAGMDRTQVLVDEMNLGALHMDCGRFGQALELLERVVQDMRQVAHVQLILAEHSLANLYVSLGRSDLAHPLLADAPAGAPTWARALRKASQARVRVEHGPHRLASLREARQVFEQGGIILDGEASALLDLQLARNEVPEAAIEIALKSANWARAHEHVGVLRHALLVEAGAQLDRGRPDLAEAPATELEAEFEHSPLSFNLYPPEVWCIVCRVHEARGRTARALQLARTGWDWIVERLEHDVPPLFKESFRQRNPFNAELRIRVANG